MCRVGHEQIGRNLKIILRGLTNQLRRLDSFVRFRGRRLLRSLDEIVIMSVL
jgi:hypothetical protein